MWWWYCWILGLREDGYPDVRCVLIDIPPSAGVQLTTWLPWIGGY